MWHRTTVRLPPRSRRRWRATLPHAWLHHSGHTTNRGGGGERGRCISMSKRQKVQYRQFALALEYVRGLGISSQTEYRERSGKGDWPSDILWEPARACGKSEWVGMSH